MQVVDGVAEGDPMLSTQDKILRLVRRSKLFIPVNRDKFVAKAWTRGADCIILDLEDSIPPSGKASARKMVETVLPTVGRGGAEIQVRINRDSEDEDLDAIVIPGLVSVMIPKCEAAEEIRRIDEKVARLEEERGFSVGSIQFDLIIETAAGIVNMETIVRSSPRIVQAGIGGVDLARDMGYVRSPALNADQFSWPAQKLLFATRAAGVQASGLAPQNNIDFTATTADPQAMLQACRRSFMLGYLGTGAIHPAWCGPINEGFKASADELTMARRVKTALEDAYAQGDGSVAVDGRMVDVTNLAHVNDVLARAEFVARREAEKAAALEAAGDVA
jgi:citrate lyase subunit beta/citryl-CoA lyase